MSFSFYDQAVAQELMNSAYRCDKCPYFYAEEGWNEKFCHRIRCLLEEEL